MFSQTASTGWEVRGARALKGYVGPQGTGGMGESSPVMTDVTEKPRDGFPAEFDVGIDGHLEDI